MQRFRIASFTSHFSSFCLKVSYKPFMTIRNRTRITDSYMISIFQFPPRNSERSWKAARRVLWRHSATSPRRSVPNSDVTADTQSGDIPWHDVARVGAYACKCQAEREGMRALYCSISKRSRWKHTARQEHCSIAVNVHTATDYHVDIKHTDSCSPVSLWQSSTCSSRLSRINIRIVFIF